MSLAYTEWGINYIEAMEALDILTPDRPEPSTWDWDAALMMTQLSDGKLHDIISCAENRDPRITIEWEDPDYVSTFTIQCKAKRLSRALGL